ncbi:hypothetical protein GTY65_10315 [Streptomyces sp. SID8379]|uniref:thioester domain-containing protein n=1 Tax=unclassified Streptomyces TaxID=2593676 RepID=UPI00039EB766|nr:MULTISPECIES: thioester domain-containing protein [unclassified Streptomyces]MYW64462.1 hypothetical protein [Streptomyces sp. SID8379]
MPRCLAGTTVLAAGLVLAVLLGWAMAALPRAVADEVPPTAPFAAVQYGTNGCIEVGARDTQPKPYAAADDYDPADHAYPDFGYDPASLGFTRTNGTNSCRYNFRDATGTTVIGSAYCVQWAKGQRTGTGYDPEPAGGVRNAGYVQRILENYWPATNEPAVPSTNATVANRQRSGTVAMAIHYFTDGIVMPPDYQDQALYAVVQKVVTDVLAAGPAPAPADPTPTVEGPDGGDTGTLIGPYTIGANATGPVTVTVENADAYTDAAGTQPFTSGDTLAPGGRLWLRSTTPATARIAATGPVTSAIGTLMEGDPTYKVQSMALAGALPLPGKSARTVDIAAGDPPRLASEVSTAELTTGQSVTDTFAVSGLTGTATLTTTLYGPLPPVNDSCSTVDWTGTPPVAHRYAPVVLTGPGRTTTPEQQIDDPGCYSFGATLDPAVGDDVSHAPGDPLETFLARPRYVPPVLSVTTRASVNTARAGDSVRDRITVSGLPEGRTLTATATLYGPLAPVADGTCEGVDWSASGLPVADRLPPLVIRSNTTYATDPVTLAQPGCYSFDADVTHDALTGGEVPVGHGLGLPAETVLVTAAPSPSPSPTPTPTTSAPATPTPATPMPTPPPAPGPHPSLPDTGNDRPLGALAVAAASFLGLGVLLVTAQRRRTSVRGRGDGAA